jgi:hypothetical protein
MSARYTLRGVLDVANAGPNPRAGEAEVELLLTEAAGDLVFIEQLQGKRVVVTIQEAAS